jgi:Lrp/AsnC family transcriptional regulator, leucine-responsive regulatory protein
VGELSFASFVRKIDKSRKECAAMQLDKIDHAILAALQGNARMPNAQLADMVGLSASACSRRLDALEAAGVIVGYHARLSNQVLGHPVTVIVHISLSSQSEKHLSEFEEAVKACPNVQMCYLMSGEHDFILRVVARDLQDFERVHKQWLSAMPYVARMHSSFALRNVIDKVGQGIGQDLF